jgi:2-polyprenyl-3-methyl-5-hydroxy-6-metoxy-1,4-benzoquinol methylase
MKFLDRAIQRWRIAKACPFIVPGTRILDIGTGDGALFRQLKTAGEGSMGVDSTLKTDTRIGRVPLIAGLFPKDMPAAEPFDVITMLAVLEHFPPSEYDQLGRSCVRFLKPGGLLIITVPSAFADRILAALKFFKLIHGMSLEEHYGYDVRQTATIFPPENFRLLRRKKFQLGLNNLFVFERLNCSRQSNQSAACSIEIQRRLPP